MFFFLYYPMRRPEGGGESIERRRRRREENDPLLQSVPVQVPIKYNETTLAHFGTAKIAAAAVAAERGDSVYNRRRRRTRLDWPGRTDAAKRPLRVATVVRIDRPIGGGHVPPPTANSRAHGTAAAVVPFEADNLFGCTDARARTTAPTSSYRTVVVLLSGRGRYNNQWVKREHAHRDLVRVRPLTRFLSYYFPDNIIYQQTKYNNNLAVYNNYIIIITTYAAVAFNPVGLGPSASARVR